MLMKHGGDAAMGIFDIARLNTRAAERRTLRKRVTVRLPDDGRKTCIYRRFAFS